MLQWIFLIHVHLSTDVIPMIDAINAFILHFSQVCQFLKRNANQHAVDEDGNDPLSVAVKNANADIVTL